MAHAGENEVTESLQLYVNQRDAQGHRLVVCNAYLPGMSIR